MKRIIVCGGRGYDDRETLNTVLLPYMKAGTVVVHGGASGADMLAGELAALGWDDGIRQEVHPADWKAHGKAAGPIRNQEMADAGADLCIAFPGGRGTADMVRRANRAGITVLQVTT